MNHNENSFIPVSTKNLTMHDFSVMFSSRPVIQSNSLGNQAISHDQGDDLDDQAVLVNPNHPSSRHVHLKDLYIDIYYTLYKLDIQSLNDRGNHATEV